MVIATYAQVYLGDPEENRSWAYHNQIIIKILWSTYVKQFVLDSDDCKSCLNQDSLGRANRSKHCRWKNRYTHVQPEVSRESTVKKPWTTVKKAWTNVFRRERTCLGVKDETPKTSIFSMIFSKKQFGRWWNMEWHYAIYTPLSLLAAIGWSTESGGIFANMKADVSDILARATQRVGRASVVQDKLNDTRTVVLCLLRPLVSHALIN